MIGKTTTNLATAAPAAEESVKRKRGRPAKGGEPILVRLSPEDRKVAEMLGHGVVAEGIRVALVAAGRMGEQSVRLLAVDVEMLNHSVQSK